MVMDNILLLNLTLAGAITLKSVADTIYFLIHRGKITKPTVRVFYSFLPLLGKNQGEQPWGVVYDSRTKQPIDPAMVTIAVHENGVGEFKQSRVTDIEGRFSFLVTPGHYVVTAEKTHYSFPSKLVAGKTDGKFTNVYHGEVIEVINPYIINLNIPMDPVDFDWNQSIKKKEKTFLIELLKNHGRTILILSAAVATGVYNAYYPSNFNLAIIAVYLFNFLFIRKRINQKLWGRTYYKITHEAAPRLKIKAVRKPYNLTVATTQSDHLGRYFLLLAQGQYAIEVYAEKDQTLLKKFENIKVTKKKEIVNFDIAI